ncbi:DUF4241 domain-containing protein [Streptomyces sp. NPDC005722]
MDEDLVTVSYAEGWDTDARRAFRPLTRAEAEERDAAGDPYVVLHRVPGRAVPAEVHLVAWRDLFVGQWVHDDSGRRTHEVDLRLLEDDRLFLRRYVERRYAAPEQPDLAPDAWRLTLELVPGRSGRQVVEERGRNGGSSHTSADVPEEQRWFDRAGFGVRASGTPRPPEEPGPGDATADAAAGGAGDEEPASLWRPPKPLRRDVPFDDLFRPGTPFPVEPWEEMVTAEPRHIAMLRVPTGRLAVCDPLAREPRELVERIPPGAYALETAVVVGEGEYGGERFPVTEEPAVRLVIREEPAVSWELALGEGEDPRLLLDGHAYGFGTDTATGGFADAGAWETLSGKVRRHYEEQDDVSCESIDEGHLRAVDETTGSDLVAFCTGGDGTWPVWLGRDAAGALVSVTVITAYL